MSNCLQPHELQHATLPCPSPSPGICPSSHSLYEWCCPAISCSDTLFSFCPQSFPATGTFPMSCPFTWDDQNTRASAAASVLPVNIQGWILRLIGLNMKIDWFDLLAVKGTYKSFLQYHSLKVSILWHSALFMVRLSQSYVTTGKTIALTI